MSSIDKRLNMGCSLPFGKQIQPARTFAAGQRPDGKDGKFRGGSGPCPSLATDNAWNVPKTNQDIRSFFKPVATRAGG
jgi:hypothetical protein